MRQESTLRKLWRLVSPLILYSVLSGITAYIFIFTDIDWSSCFNGTTIDVQQMVKLMQDWSAANYMRLRCVQTIPPLIILYMMYRRDYRYRRFVFDKKTVSWLMWPLIIGVGVFSSLAGNMLLNASDVASMSEGFQQSQELLFSGPFYLQILGIGILIPILEEMIFRGLIYMRMRQYANVNVAMVVSAFLFALYHENLVQGIYGFIIGILMAFVYEKYGSVKAPMLLHVAANLLSLVLIMINPTFSGSMMLYVIGIAAVAVTILLLYVIDKKVHADRVYLDGSVPQETESTSGRGTADGDDKNSDNENNDNKNEHSIDDYYPR